MSNEIDCESTPEIVCPYCGYEFYDSWEYGGDQSEELGLIACDNCGKEFYVTRYIHVTYDSSPATYGTCSKCGRENVVVEDENVMGTQLTSLCAHHCIDIERIAVLEKIHRGEIEIR